MTSEPVASERLDPSVIAQAGAPVVAWKARAGTLALTATSINHGASLGQPESDVIRGNAETLARRVFLGPPNINGGPTGPRPPHGPPPGGVINVAAGGLAEEAADVDVLELDIFAL